MDQTHTQRVWIAMFQLQEFTISQLVEASSVQHRTVRTVLRRYSSFVQEIEKVATGGRGGQFTRYRLTEEGQHKISELVGPAAEDRMLQRGLQASASGGIVMPVILLAIKDTLTARYPREHSAAQRQFLLRIVDKDLVTAKTDIQQAASSGQDITAMSQELHRLCSLRNRLAVDSGYLTHAVPAVGGGDLASQPVQKMVAHLMALAQDAEKQIRTGKQVQMVRAAAAACFRQTFKHVLDNFPNNALVNQQIITRFTAHESLIPLEAKDVGLFGVGSGAYSPGVLFCDSPYEADSSSEEAIVRIFVPTYLKSINNVAVEQSADLSPLELQLYQQVQNANSRPECLY